MVQAFTICLPKFTQKIPSHTLCRAKQLQEALRAHTLPESALMTLLLEKLVEDEGLNVERLRYVYDKILTSEFNDEMLYELISCNAFIKIANDLEKLKTKLKETSRSAQLWLLYLDYISIAKLFILAERTSNWELHLHVVTKMLNLFASTGHINYANSARLYVQEMKKLPQMHPWLYNKFINERHTVKRTKKNWTGIWTDLTIEQTIMRSIKSRGELTEG